MTSIFQFSRQIEPEEPEKEIDPIFSNSRKLKQNVIPPVGIAKPELVDTFAENIGNDEEIQKHINEIEAYERESPFETIKRQSLSHAARGAEQYAGSIGDSQSFIEYLTGFAFPEKEQKTREDLGKFNIPTDIQEGATPFAFKAPTSKELREITKKDTGRYLEPKTDIDKITQEIAGDIGSMSSPIAGRLPWMQRLLLPISGQSTKQTLKGLGASEKQQDIGKLATISLLSIANLGNARQVATNALNDARNMIPRGLSFNSRPTETAINQIRNSPWYRTGRNTTKGPAFDMIERIENSINNGRLNGQDAMQLRVDLNHARGELGGFRVPGNPDKAAALRHLDEVDRALLSSMEQYGTRVNPRWWNAYNQANEAFRVTRRSEAVSNFLSSTYGKPLTSEIAKIAFGTALAQGGIRVPLVGLGVGSLAVARKSYQVINRMIQSPILRNHYLNVINAASQGNAALAAKHLELFDKEAKKLEEKPNLHLASQ